METRQEMAAKLFAAGFNCAQSVLGAFCNDYGMKTKTARRLFGGFGGGVRSGEICGAVTGAVAVIGMKYGHADAGDAAAKQLCNEKTVAFLGAFRARNQSIVCRDLLAYDISRPEGYALALEQNLFSTKCVALVQDAVALLEEQGY